MTSAATNIKEHTYRLTGNVRSMLICAIILASVALSLHFYPIQTDVAVSPLTKVARIERLQSAGALSLVIECAAVMGALAVVGFLLASPWIAWTLSISSAVMTVDKPYTLGRARYVMPINEIREVTREINLIGRRERFGSKSLLESVRFSHKQASFAFAANQFRNTFEFEDFCSRIGAPPPAQV